MNKTLQIQNNVPPTSASTRRLLDLDEIEGADLPLVGGKAFRLAQLRQHGLNVPVGLVLTTNFFESQVHFAKLTPLWAGSPDIEVTSEALSWLADSLKTKPLAKELDEALTTKLNTTFGDRYDSFAVRSSAIDEDQRDHAFAGIHLTELAVPRSALRIAITRCWASALSGPAIEYRQVHGMPIQSIRTAVLIQPMLSPTVSGVAFTANPLTGARQEMVIEATWGLGNALVSGKIQPYFYKVAAEPPDYKVLEEKAGNVPPPAELASGEKNGPLSAGELANLAQHLEQIQALMGTDQDVEWAKQAQDFVILQTRPIAHIPEQKQPFSLEWTRGNYPQLLPEFPSPLWGGLQAQSQTQMMRFFKDAGLRVDQLAPLEKLILGRPYLNLTLLKKVMAQMGITSHYFLATLGDQKTATSGPIFTLDRQTAWQARAIYGSMLKQIRNADQHIAALEEQVDPVIDQIDAVSPDTPASELLTQLHRQKQIYGQLATVRLQLAIGKIILVGIGSRLIAPWVQTPITTVITLASEEQKLNRRNQALDALAEVAQRDPSTRTYFLRADNFDDYAQTNSVSSDFRQAFENLLAKYGEEAAYPADPGWPRYAEQPAQVLEIIQRLVKSKVDIEDEASTSTPPFAQVPDQVPVWRRRLLKIVTGRLRSLLKTEDEFLTLEAKTMAAIRRWCVAAGRMWASKQWLDRPEDIFWLTLGEIERTLKVGKEIGLTLPSTVKARQETYQVYRETRVPFTVKEADISSIQLGAGDAHGQPSTSDVVVGLPVSPGQARGAIAVVHNPETFRQPLEDTILVLPSTDPAWLALLHQAAGLIVETGGLLSHGSIIAREYGIPAVANIPNATQRFQTGDKVLLDGSTGVIQRLESN